MRRATSVVCLALLLCGAATSFAQVTTYYGDSNAFPRDLTVPNNTQASFLSALSVYGTDTYDTYAPFSPPPSTLTLPGIATTYSTNAALVGIDTEMFGSFSVSPFQYLSNSGFSGPPLATTFTFSAPTSAFGAYFINVGDFGHAGSTSLTITLQDGESGTPRTYPINASGNGTGSPIVFPNDRNFDATFYFGIIDQLQFDRVTITSDNPGDGILFDNLSVNAIPEPTTIALIGGMGLAGLGGYYIKRRRAMKGAEQRFRLAR